MFKLQNKNTEMTDQTKEVWCLAILPHHNTRAEFNEMPCWVFTVLIISSY